MTPRIVVCVHPRNHYTDCYTLYPPRANETTCVIGHLTNFLGRLCTSTKTGNIQGYLPYTTIYYDQSELNRVITRNLNLQTVIFTLICSAVDCRLR